jgi:tetratricopeptide (TPR) repeat protein
MPVNSPKQDSPRAAAADEASSSGASVSRDASTLFFSPQDTGVAGEDEGPARDARVSLGTHAQGERIGHYRLIDELGRGGMGVVYKAVQENLGRTVALKTITQRLNRSQAAVERFRQEAAAAAALEHGGIVQVHELGEQDGQFYFSMQFVEGEGLDRRLARGPLPPREAARIVQAAAEAVEYAHRRGVIHRDLKPANILIDADGRPRITDFGLAKRLEVDSDLTQEGQILGTPHYMSPEQAAGETAQVGPMSDLYSLGATLYALLTGRPPFQAYDAVEVVRQVRHEQPLSPRALNPQVPRDLENICLRCLAKSPEDRRRCYASVGELAEDLRRFSNHEPVRARPVGTGERLARWAKRTWQERKRWVLASAALVLLAGLAVVAAALLARQADETNRLADVQRRFETGLDADAWPPEHYRAMQLLLAEYEELAPGDADAARERLHQRFAAVTLDLIRLPQPDAATIEQIELALQLLKDEAPQAETTLRQEFEARVTRPETVAQLEPPFAAVQDVFDARAASIDGGVLRCGPPEIGPLVLTKIPCRGNLQLDATFDAGWEKSVQVSLVLNGGASPGKGYRLALFPATDGAQSLITFEQARRQSGRFTLAILRGNTYLRSSSISEAAVPPGELRITARRDGLRLSVQVNGGDELAFYDVFPSVGGDEGLFGLWWPPEAGLLRLYAARQAVPSVLSLLGEGDKLYLSGDYQAARTFYERQAIAVSGTQSAEEARVKEALCLIALKQPEPAAELLAGVVEDQSSGGRLWQDVAATQLLLLHLQRKATDQAAALVKRMALRRASSGGLLDYGAVASDEMQFQILASFRGSAAVNPWAYDDAMIERIELELDLGELLNVPESNQIFGRIHLIRRLRTRGEHNRAQGLARAYLEADKARGDLNVEAWIVRELGWMARTDISPGAAREAAVREVIGQIEVRLAGPEGAIGPSVPAFNEHGKLKLFVERARCRIALGEFDQAAAELDALIAQAAADTPLDAAFREFSDACLLRGWLHERAGQAELAKAAYARAEYPGDYNDPNLFGALAGGIGAMNTTIAGALSGNMTDQEADALAHRLIELYVPSYVPVGLVLGEAAKLGVRTTLIRDVWTTPQGREAASHLMLQDVSYGEYLRIPPVLAATHVVLTTALDKPTPAQDKLIRESLDLGFRAMIEGRLKLGMEHALLAAFTWRGTNQWPQVAPLLDDDLRGRAAYIVGLRFKRLGRGEEAKKLFEEAVSLAGGNKELAELAKAELP